MKDKIGIATIFKSFRIDYIKEDKAVVITFYKDPEGTQPISPALATPLAYFESVVNQWNDFLDEIHKNK